MRKVRHKRLTWWGIRSTFSILRNSPPAQTPFQNPAQRRVFAFQPLHTHSPELGVLQGLFVLRGGEVAYLAGLVDCGAPMAYKDKADQAMAAKAHYLANKADYIARAKDGRVKNREKVHRHISGYLSDNPCIDCGERDPIVLEFDHQPGFEKRFNLGDAAKRGFSLNSVIAEISKCVIRCANCHRRKTYHERMLTHRG